MQRPGRRIAMVAILIVVGISLVYGMMSRGVRSPAATRGFGDVIGVIHINGAITGGGSSDIFFETSANADSIMKQLQDALHNPSIKAVVIRMNTPGGSAAASEEIGREVKRLRDSGKVVVTSMGDLAASGGYWIAATTDHIMASPATLTGSIGVIWQITNLEGLYEKLGMRVETIKSGEHKDMTSPVRERTQEELELIQGLVDDMFEQFVDVVAEGRNMSREEVMELADGRIFSGRMAMELGLVDSLGNYNDAIAKAAELAGLDDGYEVREMRKARPWDMFLSGLSALTGSAFGLPWQEGIGPGQMTLIRWELYPQAN